MVLNRREQLRLARHLGVPLTDFLERYTEVGADGHVSLRFEDGHCVMLDGKACSVHEAKPTQCRTWPFWPELMKSRAVYEREVRSFCPGSRNGPTVSGASIRSQLLQIELADDAAEQDAKRRR